MEWIVSSEESGLKLVDFLKLKLNSLSLKGLKKGIESNACLVNSRVERFASARVGTGDIITYEYVEKKETSIQVLYEDEALFICCKNSGISSDEPLFLKGLEILAKSPLFLLHRLDKDTSGVLLFAKTKEMEKEMLYLFRQRQIKKEYLAIVDGIPNHSSGIIDNQLGKIHSYQGQTIWGAVKSNGLRACTEWKVLQKGKFAALLLCRPITGRTHQIRVHCSEMGHPILGDYQYGRRFRCSYRPSRLLLNASRVSFIHPLTKIELSVEAPLPEDMEKALKYILNQSD